MAKRNIGIHASIGPLRSTPISLRRPTPLEDRHEYAVGRADREQVHDHGLERHEQAAEHGHQQQEAEQQHDAEQPRHPFAEVGGEVGGAGGGAADLGVDAGRRDHVVAQRVDELVRRRVLRGALGVEEDQGEVVDVAPGRR